MVSISPESDLQQASSWNHFSSLFQETLVDKHEATLLIFSTWQIEIGLSFSSAILLILQLAISKSPLLVLQFFSPIKVFFSPIKVFLGQLVLPLVVLLLTVVPPFLLSFLFSSRSYRSAPWSFLLLFSFYYFHLVFFFSSCPWLFNSPLVVLLLLPL